MESGEKAQKRSGEKRDGLKLCGGKTARNSLDAEAAQL